MSNVHVQKYIESLKKEIIYEINSYIESSEIIIFVNKYNEHQNELPKFIDGKKVIITISQLPPELN